MQTKKGKKKKKDKPKIFSDEDCIDKERYTTQQSHLRQRTYKRTYKLIYYKIIYSRRLS